MTRSALVLLAIATATIAATKGSSAQAPLAGRFRAGPVTMELTAAGEARFTGPRGLLVAARFRVAADTIELRDESGPVACPGQPGRYRWRLTADTLQFQLVADPCDGRRAALGRPWARVPSALVLRGVTLIDGTGAPARAGMTLVLEDDSILAVRPDGPAPLPPDAEVRDLAGHWVGPGLIDAHVHLATRPSDVDRRDRVERRLANALRGGVVAVRDMGGDARALADLARAARAGDIESPLVRYAAIMAGPEFFDDPRVRASSAGVPLGSAPWARAITPDLDLRQAVAEAKGAGVAAVKLYAELDSSGVARVAAEAKRQGLGVWSHAAVLPAGPAQLVAAGVQVLSHAVLVAWEGASQRPGGRARYQLDYDIGPEHPAVARVIAAMRESGAMLEPTLFVFRAPRDAADTSTARRRERSAIAITRAAYRAGVRIVAGTDGIGGEEAGQLPNIHTELELLVDAAGLSPMDALVAATRTAAEVLGLSATHGTIAAGKAADLVVLSADPLADIRNTRAIALVIRHGKPVPR